MMTDDDTALAELAAQIDALAGKVDPESQAKLAALFRELIVAFRNA